MEYAKLGRTDLVASRIGMGCWAIGGHGWGPVDDHQSIQTIHRALDLGVTVFDTADVYGLGHSEEILGRALGERIRDVVVVTKFGVTVDSSGKAGRDCSPRHVFQAVEASLARLRLEQIPLYLIHWPDSHTPIAETMQALTQCRDQGKIRFIGCSNFSTQELMQAQQWGRIDVLQIPYNVLRRDVERDELPYCAKMGIGVIAYDVLAKGLLTKRFTSGTMIPADHVRSKDPQFQPETFERNLKYVDRIEKVGQGYGKNAAQTAIRWVLDHPAVGCALTGASRAEQIAENVGALEWSLKPDHRQLLAAPI